MNRITDENHGGVTTSAHNHEPRPDQRLARKYCFDDADMDLFFMAAVGWGPSGGLDVGEAYYVASRIADGDADSWVRSFGDFGGQLDAQADAWLARGWRQSAGEARLKAFASYRSAWQFAEPGGEAFSSLYARHKRAFASALGELGIPATFFHVPYGMQTLPGVYFQGGHAGAPLVLVIGGADTCFEDLFLTVGRNLLSRGYSVALVDLPGQGNLASQGLYWEAESEKPIGCVVDLLVDQFGAQPGRIAVMGLSLGGYFVTRAAGYESRFGAVIASTPFPRPGEMFARAVEAAMQPHAPPSSAGRRSRQFSMWKAGADDPRGFVTRSSAMVADPSRVTVPFLSIVGAGDSPIFLQQAYAWHDAIRSSRKDLVLLDASTGADGHVQVNNRRRLAQESSGWLDEVFGRATAY